LLPFCVILLPFCAILLPFCVILLHFVSYCCHFVYLQQSRRFELKCTFLTAGCIALSH
jgi:hypothetical protein